MNASAQRVNFNMDELPASRSTDAAVVGVAALDPSINQAIRSAISRSIGSLTGNLTQVVKSRLTQSIF